MIKLLLLLVVSFNASANPLLETRYCGQPKRNASGDIIRRADVLAAFQKIYKCPSTGLKTGACPGFARDHVIPLKCGGCDAVSNLSYLPNVLKSGAGKLPKDRWELKVYCKPEQIVQMPINGRLVIE